jgi:hypothetical protein
MLAEFLLPMLVLLTLAVCFVAVRKKQQRTLQRLEKYETENMPETDFEISAPEPGTDKNATD